MDDDEFDLAAKTTDALGQPVLGSGRLGTYTALGAASGVVPLPWVPDAIVRRIRGALIHDLTSRHGLSLSPEARAVLVEPSGSEGRRGLFSQGLLFAVTRTLGRLGPLALLPPVRTALGTFVLGHLLERYLDTARTSRSVRIDVDEARRIRRAIDQAMLQALTTEAPSGQGQPTPIDDQRESTTQLIDGVLISLANVPDWVVRRLDAAFDEVITTVRS